MGYTKKRFEELFDEFIKEEQMLLGIKRDEYTIKGEDDCLQNFREIASFRDMRPEEVCMLYLLKHIQSINRAITSGKYNFTWWNDDVKVEGMKQRIADARNYLLLLAATIDDRQKINPDDMPFQEGYQNEYIL